MSNALAIATVTATIQQLILDQVVQEFSGAQVKFGQPAAPEANPPPTVNICLYQVGTNLAYRNHDMPVRNSAGQLIQLPRIGLNLYYLLSFYGDEQNLEPQRLLGTTVRTLHTYSVLTNDLINATIEQPLYSFLATSNLADEPIEQVKIIPHFANANGEGGAGSIWSTFFNYIPYALSVPYEASMVIIDSTETVQPGTEVQTRNLSVGLV